MSLQPGTRVLLPGGRHEATVVRVGPCGYGACPHTECATVQEDRWTKGMTTNYEATSLKEV